MKSTKGRCVAGGVGDRMRASVAFGACCGQECPRSDEGRDWKWLLEQTELFAQRSIDRLWWRGAKGGVLPDGYDANSVAAEAVWRMLRRQESDPEAAGSALDSRWRAKETRLDSDSCLEIQAELRNLAHNIVRGLHRRRETALVRNEEESGIVLDELPSPGASPDEALMRQETLAELERFKREFCEYLKDDVIAKGVFGCFCDEVIKRQEIAERLGVGVAMVTNAQKQLRRKVAKFLAERGKDFEEMKRVSRVLGPKSKV